MIQQSITAKESRQGGQASRCSRCATRSICIVSCVDRATGLRLGESTTERGASKGDVLQVQGELAPKIAIVKMGVVAGTRQIRHECGAYVAVFGKGSILGSESLRGHPNTLGATALTFCRICEISVDDLYRIGAVSPAFLGCLTDSGARSFSVLADWANMMHVKGVQQRLHLALYLLARQSGAQVIRLPSHVVLASLLSITRESVARNLRLLEEQGVLKRLDRWHCELLSLPGATEPPTEH